MDISPETREKLDKILAEVDKQLPPVETVRLKLSRGETTAFDSKMGGKSYFPKGMEYPTVREGENAGKPLKFLAQLNFGSLPRIEGFPSEGILQFFIFPDDFSGADFDNLTKQNGFRVIYHEKISDDTAALIESVPEVEFEEWNFPFKGEFLLTAEKAEKMPVTEYDFRFTEYCVKAYNELTGAELESFYDIYNVDKLLSDALYQRRAIVGTRIGGYPHFEQEDPRGYNDELQNHTVLLFQSDSEVVGGNFDNEVIWGDMGVANFFITPEDLARRDFSNVIYTWDCG